MSAAGHDVAGRLETLDVVAAPADLRWGRKKEQTDCAAWGLRKGMMGYSGCIGGALLQMGFNKKNFRFGHGVKGTKELS